MEWETGVSRRRFLTAKSHCRAQGGMFHILRETAMEKNISHKTMYICITESLYCTAEINIAL